MKSIIQPLVDKARYYLALAGILAASSHPAFATDAALTKVAAANNEFAFNLLRRLAAEQPAKNLFISPYSAATALQITANGANGVTKQEMQQVLHTAGLSDETINAGNKSCAELLKSADTDIILSTANALWYRQGVPIKESFVALNQKYFSATIQPLDFRNVSASEAEINQWASDQTHGRIRDIANGLIDPNLTDMVLANAIYFKGKWLEPFDKNLTQQKIFHAASGRAMEVPMMRKVNEMLSYRRDTGHYQAVRLPYMGDKLAMYVFLPDDGSSPDQLLQSLTADNWQEIVTTGFKRNEGELVLPKFKIESGFELKDTLRALGMKTAFEPGRADFSGIFNGPHNIDKVRQNTFVEVGEEGTEAAAVTAVEFTQSAAVIREDPPFRMIVDRPFVFAIADARSQMLLFLGVVNDLR
jgi:serine protease inhibitor